MVYIDIETLAEQISQASFPSEGSSDAAVCANEEAQDAFKKIERLVKVRDRSVCETRKRLVRDGYSDSAIQSAVEKALYVRYLDDTRFADVLVRSRLRAGKGLPGVIRELREHEIDPERILVGFPDSYLEQFPNQEDAAYRLLCRKPPRAKNVKQAAYAKLIRSGYSSAVAADAVKLWLRDREDV